MTDSSKTRAPNCSPFFQERWVSGNSSLDNLENPRIWTGTNGESSFSSFFRLQSFEGLSFQVWMIHVFWPCCPRPLGGSHKPARTGRPTESGDGWVSSVGELGVGWFTNERPGGSPFPAVFFSGEPGGPRFCRSALMVIFSSFPG